MGYENEMGQMIDTTEEHFDYILRPCVRGFLGSNTRAFLIFFFPVFVFLLAPDLFDMMEVHIHVFRVIGASVTLFFFALLINELRRRNTVLKLHIDYLVYKKGIIFKSIDRVYFQDIKNIRIVKGMTDSLLGLGTLAIATAGTSGYEVVISGFAHPEEIMRYIAIHRKEGE